jgi:hypothetical protein
MANERRRFLTKATALGIGSLAFSLSKSEATTSTARKRKKVSAPEDLMREHGVPNRILLICKEGLRRLRAKEEIPPEVFARPAALVRKFVEEYHEKLEEKLHFPRV